MNMNEIFYISIYERSNRSMKGNLTWTASGKTVEFSATKEMIHMMNQALNSKYEEPAMKSWNI